MINVNDAYLMFRVHHWFTDEKICSICISITKTGRKECVKMGERAEAHCIGGDVDDSE